MVSYVVRCSGVDSGMQWQHTGPATGHHDPSLCSSTSGWGAAAGPPPSAAQPPPPPQPAAAAGEYVSGVSAARQFAAGTSSSTFSQRLPQQAAAATFTDAPPAKYGLYGRPPAAVYPQHKYDSHAVHFHIVLNELLSRSRSRSYRARDSVTLLE